MPLLTPYVERAFAAVPQSHWCNTPTPRLPAPQRGDLPDRIYAAVRAIPRNQRRYHWSALAAQFGIDEPTLRRMYHTACERRRREAK